MESLVNKIHQIQSLNNVRKEIIKNIIDKYWNQQISYEDYCAQYLSDDDNDDDDDIQYRAGKQKYVLHVRMYVCIYVCMYVCMYVWIYVCMYVCMYVIYNCVIYID